MSTLMMVIALSIQFIESLTAILLEPSIERFIFWFLYYSFLLFNLLIGLLQFSYWFFPGFSCLFLCSFLCTLCSFLATLCSFLFVWYADTYIIHFHFNKISRPQNMPINSCILSIRIPLLLVFFPSFPDWHITQSSTSSYYTTLSSRLFSQLYSFIAVIHVFLV